MYIWSLSLLSGLVSPVLSVLHANEMTDGCSHLDGLRVGAEKDQGIISVLKFSAPLLTSGGRARSEV